MLREASCTCDAIMVPLPCEREGAGVSAKSTQPHLFSDTEDFLLPVNGNLGSRRRLSAEPEVFQTEQKKKLPCRGNARALGEFRSWFDRLRDLRRAPPAGRPGTLVEGRNARTHILVLRTRSPRCSTAPQSIAAHWGLFPVLLRSPQAVRAILTSCVGARTRAEAQSRGEGTCSSRLPCGADARIRAARKKKSPRRCPLFQHRAEDC